MRKRNYQTSMNILLDASLYQRLKMIANLNKTSMSKFIREGIHLKLAQYDKEHNVVIVG